MRTQTVVAFGIAGMMTLLSIPAQGQTVVTRQTTHAVASAEAIERQAIDLYAQPQRADEAARLHRQSAHLRAADDPQAVQSLVMAARLFNYAHRLLDARKTMEEAAERALAMGDVVRAAQAYVDAAFLAQAQGSQSQVNRLGRKAVVLASSPLLRPDERAGIVDRIRSSSQLAALVR